jgi:hypothetical protein
VAVQWQNCEANTCITFAYHQPYLARGGRAVRLGTWYNKRISDTGATNPAMRVLEGNPEWYNMAFKRRGYGNWLFPIKLISIYLLTYCLSVKYPMNTKVMATIRECSSFLISWNHSDCYTNGYIAQKMAKRQKYQSALHLCSGIRIALGSGMNWIHCRYIRSCVMPIVSSSERWILSYVLLRKL